MPLCRYAAMPLCRYAPMLLCSYAPVLLCSCAPMLLCSYAPMLLVSERLSDPEIGVPSAERVLAVEAAGEVPMQLEAEQLERQPVTQRRFAVDEHSVLAEVKRLS